MLFLRILDGVDVRQQRAEETEFQTKNRNVVNYREQLIFHSGMHNWLGLDWIGSEASIWHRMVSHSVMRERMILPVRPIPIQRNSFIIINGPNGMRVDVSLKCPTISLSGSDLRRVSYEIHIQIAWNHVLSLDISYEFWNFPCESLRSHLKQKLFKSHVIIQFLNSLPFFVNTFLSPRHLNTTRWRHTIPTILKNLHGNNCTVFPPLWHSITLWPRNVNTLLKRHHQVCASFN